MRTEEKSIKFVVGDAQDYLGKNAICAGNFDNAVTFFHEGNDEFCKFNELQHTHVCE